MQFAQGFHEPCLQVAFAARVFPAADGGRTGSDAGGEFGNTQVQLLQQFPMILVVIKSLASEILRPNVRRYGLMPDVSVLEFFLSENLNYKNG